MDREQRTDGFTAVEDRFAGYTVYDRDGSKIGKVDDLFVDEVDNPEYIGVKMGFFGMSSTIVPMEAVRVDDGEQALYVEAEKDQVKNGPRFDQDNEITPEYERQVREYYGLGAMEATEERGAYGVYDDDRNDRVSGDENELRVQRSEEELRAGIREREAGQVSVRKRVRTERERIAVPKRREEVSVDRVPVDREASEPEIGEDEVSVPVVEEEIVVEKRPVVKEEIRVRKDVVEDEEVVEEDVRKEEIDIDDEATRRRG